MSTRKPSDDGWTKVNDTTWTKGALTIVRYVRSSKGRGFAGERTSTLRADFRAYRGAIMVRNEIATGFTLAEIKEKLVGVQS